MLRSDFEYLLQKQILIIEGSLRYEIQKRAGSADPFLPNFILNQPDLIRAVHREFADAGARLLIPATAAANRLILQKKHIRDQFEEVNRKAVLLCRESKPKDGLLFASLGPTGALLKPYGRLSESDYRDIFREQAQILLDAEVDGFILEGFSSLIEAEQCILALREISAAPIIATMTFLEEGLTKFGDTTADCFGALLKKGADVVGIHGTLGPLEIDEFLSRLTRRYPLCVRPNAGYPVRIGNTMTYLTSPDYVAEYAELFVNRGAVIVGGAAGFTPGHIRVVSERLRGKVPVTPEPRENGRRTRVSGSASADPLKPKEPIKSLADKLGKEPILSVELEPPKGLAFGSIIELLQRLVPYGVDAVNIPENPLARARVSSISLAKAIHEQTGIESIAHLTCRDRNLISLQAELLGAHVLGVNTILALTGDPAGVGDYPTATSVFDVDSFGLVEIMSRMNLGKDFGMNDLGARTRFNIGVATNPLAQDLAGELNRIEEKVKRGATFVQTQPIFDAARAEPFLKAMDSIKVPVIFGVMLIRNYRHAKFLVNEYPGIHIRQKDLTRFEKADETEQANLGITLACELVGELSAMSGGVYLMPSFGESDRLVDVCKRLKEA